LCICWSQTNDCSINFPTALQCITYPELPFISVSKWEEKTWKGRDANNEPYYLSVGCHLYFLHREDFLYLFSFHRIHNKFLFASLFHNKNLFTSADGKCLGSMRLEERVRNENREKKMVLHHNMIDLLHILYEFGSACWCHWWMYINLSSTRSGLIPMGKQTRTRCRCRLTYDARARQPCPEIELTVAPGIGKVPDKFVTHNFVVSHPASTLSIIHESFVISLWYFSSRFSFSLFLCLSANTQKTFYILNLMKFRFGFYFWTSQSEMCAHCTWKLLCFLCSFPSSIRPGVEECLLDFISMKLYT
jgi:hypothetical protein